MTALTVPSHRARADVGVVLAFAGSTQLSHRADVRVVGRQLRAKAHRALARDRGKRRTIEREATPGAYAALPAWAHRDQWLAVVEAAAVVWFPEQLHRQVRVATLLKFAALVAAHADDTTGRSCWRPYPDLARGMAVTVETVRKCWRALERLGLAVQVERSVCFGYDQRMQLWRKGTKQRGLTPEYALVVPAAFSQAIVTGEHPGDLLAQKYRDADSPAEPSNPSERLSAALWALRNTAPAPLAATPERCPAGAAAGPYGDQQEAGSSPETGLPQGPVDDHRQRPTTQLGNIDILGLPRSGTRPKYLSCLALVSHVPHGVKSTASRAHNRGRRTDSTRPGGTPARGHAQKRQTGRGGWFGPHRDIAVFLTRRVLWLHGVQPGRIAMQLRRYTVPGLPLVWRPADFVAAFDALNRRQGRYSPGANMASPAKADQGHAASAAAGAVTSPAGLLKWYLEQIDPVNDHPRFQIEAENERIATSVAERRAAAAREQAEATRLEASSVRDAWQATRNALKIRKHGG